MKKDRRTNEFTTLVKQLDLLGKLNFIPKGENLTNAEI